jgi:hypothetical protein
VIDATALDALAHFFLGPDGELYTGIDCRTSLRDIALRHNKYHAYRDLQATIIAHYFDLTHSLDEVAGVQKREPQPLKTAGTPLESIERLVIPRVFRKKSSVSGSSDQPIRTLRRHGVTWHVRKLPEGWRASPRAHELARELGVTLGEHETIVKEHKRGSKELGEVTSHRW